MKIYVRSLRGLGNLEERFRIFGGIPSKDVVVYKAPRITPNDQQKSDILPLTLEKVQHKL